MADIRITDLDWIKWILSGLVGFITLLLGFGVRDLRRNMEKIPDIAADSSAMKVYMAQIEKRLEKVERECAEKHRHES
jgi:hypothetical protein